MKKTTQTDMPLTHDEIAAQIATRRETVYPFVLVFARVFTSGTLDGIRHVDSLPFCSETDANAWVTGINRRNAAGKVAYRVAAHETRRAA